jgi:uncharacterized membrane protein (DUF485 family)
MWSLSRHPASRIVAMHRRARMVRYGARRCRVLGIMFLVAFLGLLGPVSLSVAMSAARLGYYGPLVTRALVVGVVSLVLAGLLAWIYGPVQL